MRAKVTRSKRHPTCRNGKRSPPRSHRPRFSNLSIQVSPVLATVSTASRLRREQIIALSRNNSVGTKRLHAKDAKDATKSMKTKPSDRPLKGEQESQLIDLASACVLGGLCGLCVRLVPLCANSFFQSCSFTQLAGFWSSIFLVILVRQAGSCARRRWRR